MAKTIVIPTNPVDQKAINDAIDEGVNALLSIDSHREHVNEIIDMVKEKFQLPKGVIRRLITTKYRGTFDKEVQDSEDFVELYETVVK